MALLGFDLLVLGWILLMVAILLAGRSRGTLGRRRTYIYAGMFLALVPLMGGNAVESAGLVGQDRLFARVILGAIGVGSLGLAVYGHRVDEDDPDAESGSSGTAESSGR